MNIQKELLVKVTADTTSLRCTRGISRLNLTKGHTSVAIHIFLLQNEYKKNICAYIFIFLLILLGLSQLDINRDVDSTLIKY